MDSGRALGVLIVEDERIVAMDLQQTLSRMGYEAFAIAASADEAFRRATERRPDIVLMDIRIKGERDGIETAAMLREHFGVPIVYLTAHADDATIARAKHTEPYGYLLKPVKSAELRSVLEVSFYKASMERRLRERERWFSTTLRSIADGVIAVDTQCRVTFMNAVAEALTGTTLDAALGRPVREVLRLSGVTDDSPLEAVLARREAIAIDEASLASIEGVPLRIISDSAAPVVDDGELLGAVMVFKDITQQKAMQRQLEASDRLASLGTMAAGIAHEVNNPLSALFLNATYVHDEVRRLLVELERDVLEREGAIGTLGALAEAQAEILSTTERIARIAADLTAFCRRRDHVVTSVFGDVTQAVEWAVRMTAAQLRRKAVVTMEVEPEIPQVALDDTRLGQVLLNLLINAAHAIPAGESESNHVRIAARRDADRVRIEVSDSGIGMSSEVASRIFEPFFTTKPIGEGTGLGLSVSYGLVKAVGGELTVSSEPGVGSTFTIELPIARPS